MLFILHTTSSCSRPSMQLFPGNAIIRYLSLVLQPLRDEAPVKIRSLIVGEEQLRWGVSQPGHGSEQQLPGLKGNVLQLIHLGQPYLLQSKHPLFPGDVLQSMHALAAAPVSRLRLSRSSRSLRVSLLLHHPNRRQQSLCLLARHPRHAQGPLFHRRQPHSHLLEITRTRASPCQSRPRQRPSRSTRITTSARPMSMSIGRGR